MSLWEYDITKKGQINKIITLLKFEIHNDKDYKVGRIWNNTIYDKK